MKPVNIEPCNDVLLPPSSWDERKLGKCRQLPIHRTQNHVQSFWRPDAAELAALNDGGYVSLLFPGTTHAPVSVDVTLPSGNAQDTTRGAGRATIWKFPIGRSEESISVPQGAKLLACRVQQGIPVLWFQVPVHEGVPVGNTCVNRTFILYVTGDRVDTRDTYIDTLLNEDGTFVWHVYERVK